MKDKIAVAYLYDITWESDFIFNEILADLRKDLVVFKFGAAEYIKHKPGLTVRTSIRSEEEYKLIVDPLIKKLQNFKKIILCISQQNIGDELSYIMVRQMRPDVVFYLSDELGQRKHIIDIYKYSKLVLYNYNSYADFTFLPNCIQFPLGYVSTYIGGKSVFNITHKPANKRKYAASFVGQIKQDRALMLEQFRQNFSEKELYLKPVSTIWDISKLPVPPPDMYNIYADSIFVPVGRGTILIDCFRIYEAMAAGAIPVIVCRDLELVKYLNYEKNILPHVPAGNWNEAVAKCKTLLANPEELLALQTAAIEWFKNRILYTRECIKKVILCDKDIRTVAGLRIIKGGANTVGPFPNWEIVQIAGAVIIVILFILIIRLKNNNNRHTVALSDNQDYLLSLPKVSLQS